MPPKALIHHISVLPSTSGVYLYKDADNKILYVGKAKNLKSRVRSYFRKSAALGPSKERMISLVADLATISTDTELEALVLEANLVREHQPPYNVLLRDDKYYLFIKITKEEPPRIFPVRKMKKDGSRYFGPYSSAASVRATLKLLRRIFPFREEKDRPRDIIFPHPLFSHISPPHMRGRQRGSETSEPHPHPAHAGLPLIQGGEIANVIKFLQGHRQDIITTLKQGIAESANNLEFERAALFRDQLQAIIQLEGYQKVYLSKKESFDVVSFVQARNQSAGNILQIRDGKLLGKQTFLLRHTSESSPEEILRQFIVQYYAVAQDVPKKIYLPFALQDQNLLEKWISARLLVPQRGVKKQLIAMGETNAQTLLNEQKVVTQTKQASQGALTALLKIIGVAHQPQKPFRIETYDVSNIQGTLATASMIVFLDGMPAKQEYRKFRIQYGNPPASPATHASNDFAMLEETLTRRLAHTTWPAPDLIIIDGGKGQLSSAIKALGKSDVNIPIISIAKQEEIIYVSPHPNPLLSKERGTTQEIRITYDSPALFLIQRMRDEAHRFTITYHRSLRSREQIKSVLDEIAGIGPKTKKLLLKTFGSVSGIKNADDSELEKIIGKKKTKVLREQL